MDPLIYQSQLQTFFEFKKIEDQDSYTDGELLSLRIVAYVVISLLALNLLFLISNLVRFLIPLKVRSKLLGLFYILAALMTVAVIIELVYFVLPSNKLPSLTTDTLLGQEIANGAQSMTNVAIGCLFVATMYQISLSIQMIDNPMCDLGQLEKRKCCIYTATTISFIVFTASMVCCFYLNERKDHESHAIDYLMCTAYLILPIAYIWTLCQLNKAMQCLLAENIKSERTDVLNQFILFIVSYVTRFLFSLCQLYFFQQRDGRVFVL